MKNLKQPFFLLLTLVLFLASSCGEKSESLEDEKTLENNFVIQGQMLEAEGLIAYFETVSNSGVIPVAQSVIAKNGSYKIEGNIPGMGIYQLRIGESKEMAIPITLVPGDKLTIKSSLSGLMSATKISGVEWANAYPKYLELINTFGAGQQELMNLQGQVPVEQLQQRYMLLKKPLDQFALTMVNKNPGSSFNLVLSNSLMPVGSFNDYPQENLDALKKMYTAFERKYSGSPITEALGQQVMQIESGFNEFNAMKSGSNPAPEIALKTPEGKELRLSSLKGKIVLIDFWASWCGPCRKENPNVIRLYQKYKNKGFTVFSVSLDTDGAKWKQAIEQDGLVWPNHVSDLLGWQTPMTQLYGFNGIPHTVLVNKDGNIIGTGLRGAELEQKLEELF